jgi:exopolysaccharide production protein ExoZ
MPAAMPSKRAMRLNWLAQKFELSRGGGANNLRPMEGLRGFAVFLVFLVHYVTLSKPWIEHDATVLVFATALHTIGNSGVDLFFVLSGFLIYGSLLGRPPNYLRFMSRRIERIYPAFVAVFIVYMLLSWAFPAESKIPGTASDAAIYLIQNLLLLPGLFPIQPVITVAWSLSYEMFYYLAIPVIIGALGLRDRRPRWRVSFFLVVSGLVATYCAANGGHIRLIMFISGVLLFEAMNCGDRIRRPSSAVGMAALVMGLLGTLLPLDGFFGYATKISILFAAFFLLCLACLRNPSGWLAASFSWAPLRWLGNMSYSYYLLHGLSLKASFLVLAKLLPGAPFGSWFFWALLPAMFALTLLPTAGLFLLVERPFSLAPTNREAAPQN